MLLLVQSLSKRSDLNHLLMIFHQNLHKWLQPGGHVDLGEHSQDAAIREMFPINIDIYLLPENIKKQGPAHGYYDFRYLIMIDSNYIGDNSEKNEVL